MKERKKKGREREKRQDRREDEMQTKTETEKEKKQTEGRTKNCLQRRDDAPGRNIFLDDDVTKLNSDRTQHGHLRVLESPGSSSTGASWLQAGSWALRIWRVAGH